MTIVKKNKLQIKETKRILKKDIIVSDFLMRKLQEETDSDIKELSKSLSNGGMINEINVRESKDAPGKYELIAGARRFVATKEDRILAKVYEDMSNLRAKLTCVQENLHRRDPESNVTDAYIYDIWKDGKQDKVFKTIKDLEDEIGMEYGKLCMVISAGELKDKEKDNVIIQNATTSDIHRTKDLSEHLDLREDLLKKKQDNKITSEDMGKISEEIKNELDTGTEKEIVKTVLAIVDNNAEPAKTNGSRNNILEKSKAITTDVSGKERKIDSCRVDNKRNESVKISDSKFVDTLIAYKTSPSDVQEKLEKKEIDVNDAMLLNQFDTPARRDHVLKELKIAEEVHDWDKKKTVDTRLKQQEQLNNKGETDLKTRQDRAYEEELRKERNKDQTHDQRCLDRYQRMSVYILETVSGFNPKTLKTDEIKRKATKIFRGNYELFHSILVKMGEIEEIIEENATDDKTK